MKFFFSIIFSYGTLERSKNEIGRKGGGGAGRTCVPHDVVHEMLLARERLVASVAAMRRLTCVLSHMIHHVLLPGECLRAELAAIWSLPGVTSERVRGAKTSNY